MAINMDGLLHDKTTLQNYSKAQMNIVVISFNNHYLSTNQDGFITMHYI